MYAYFSTFAVIVINIVAIKQQHVFVPRGGELFENCKEQFDSSNTFSLKLIHKTFTVFICVGIFDITAFASSRVYRYLRDK